MLVRDELPSDRAAIWELLDQAFPDESVGQLVDDLRTEGDLTLSLVATIDDRVVGHIGFSSVAIAPCLVRAYQLSPLAVDAAHRRRGIGAELVRAGIDRCLALDADAILLLGNPAYYRRFGFDVDRAAHLRSRWSGPHFQALELRPGALRACRFLSLAPAFERLP